MIISVLFDTINWLDILMVTNCAAFAALCTRWRNWVLLDLMLTHQLQRSWLTEYTQERDN